MGQKAFDRSIGSVKVEAHRGGETGGEGAEIHALTFKHIVQIRWWDLVIVSQLKRSDS